MKKFLSRRHGRSRFSASATKSRANRNIGSAVFRPIEQLEQRALFSTAVWDGGGADNNWTTGANWVSNVAPVSGDALKFSGTVRTSPNNNFTAGTSFASIELASNGFTLSGNQVSLTGGITQDGTAATATMSLPVVVPAGVGSPEPVNVVSGTLSMTGNITGTGSISKQGAGTLSVSGTNSYAGATLVSAGTMNISGDQSAAAGGWTIGNAATSTPVTVNFNTGSTVVVSSGNAIQINQTAGTASAATLNVAGTVTDNGTLGVARDAVLNLNSGAAWNQAGPMSISPNANTTYNSSVAMLTGSSLNYTNGSAITLAPSTSTGTGNGVLTLAGGIFTTGQGFADNVASSGGSSKILMSNNGTFVASADIPSLLTTTGSTANFQITSGMGRFNTSGHAMTVTQSISGSGSISKLGTGPLTLAASNSYSGGTNINADVLLATNSNALGTGTVAIFNGGTNTASLQLSGGITIANPFSGLNSEVAGGTPTFESVSGNNTISSNLSITGTGGTSVIFQSDAGTFTLSGGLTTTLTTSRVYYFQGAGNGVVSGNITDDASHILSVAQNGPGTWSLTGTNTYAAGTTINGGTLSAHGASVSGVVTAKSTGTFNDTTIAGAAWTDNDLGAPALAGVTTFNTNNSYTIAGAGADITASADQFNFASQPFSGDGGITALVNGTAVNTDSTTTTGSKDGIMFRDSLLYDSPFVEVGYTTGSGIQLLYRLGNGTTVQVGGTVSTVSGPVWLSLTRVQGAYTASYSTDGFTFNSVGTISTDNVSENALVGLALTSHNVAKVATATFSNVSINNSFVASKTEADLSFTVPWLASSDTLVYAKTGGTWHLYADVPAGQSTAAITGLTASQAYTVELASATAVQTATGSITGNTPPTLSATSSTVVPTSTNVFLWQVTADASLSEGIAGNTNTGTVTVTHEFVYASNSLEAAQVAGIGVTNFASTGTSGTSTAFTAEVTGAGNTGHTAPAFENSLAELLSIPVAKPILAVEDGTDADYNDAYANITILSI